MGPTPARVAVADGESSLALRVVCRGYLDAAGRLDPSTVHVVPVKQQIQEAPAA